MSTGWVKSLQCKSNALDDVYQPIASSSSSSSSLPRKPLLPLSCGASSSHALKDIVFLLPKHPSLPKKTPSSSSSRHGSKPLLSPPPEPKPKQRRRPKKPRPKPNKPTIPSPPPAVAPPSAALAALPEGHSSRRVVEIIFSSSWSPLGGAPFPGEIEMLFRVHNPPRTAARFEEYRDAVRSRSGGGGARCAADGNEMMRFHCSSPSAGGASTVYDAGVACCEVAGAGGKAVSAIRTFSGSGGAHESSGGGAGRRAMLVCRVIAGRVRTGPEIEPDAESVCAGPGELLVFDSRAVLPCFLIIYKI